MDEKSLLERRPTLNLVAYDLYLKARATLHAGDPTAETASLLQKAVELDPDFADAWSELGRVFAEWYFSLYGARNPENLAIARHAIERAQALAPDSPEVVRNLGNYYLYGHRDYGRAAGQLEKLARLRPNDPEVYVSLGEVHGRQAQWREALDCFRRAARLDRGSVAYAQRLCMLLVGGRRWDEAIAEQRRIVLMLPDNLDEAYQLAFLHFRAHGSRREAETFFAGLSPAEAESPQAWALRMEWTCESGNYAESLRLYRLHPEFHPNRYYVGSLGVAFMLVAEGDVTGAREIAASRDAELRSALEREPGNGWCSGSSA